jgi:alkylation response protein AidB-like acyl-CoA dehydrogenase
VSNDDCSWRVGLYGSLATCFFSESDALRSEDFDMAVVLAGERHGRMTYDAAWRIDQGREVRTEASMIKVFGTKMATDIIDQAMQTYGATGMTKVMPLQLMASQVRTIRIYEGPSEVHRWVIARNQLRPR